MQLPPTSSWRRAWRPVGRETEEPLWPGQQGQRGLESMKLAKTNLVWVPLCHCSGYLRRRQEEQKGEEERAEGDGQ